MGDLLRMRQSQGLELPMEEVAKFEVLRDSFMNDPVAQGFLDAQEQLQQLHDVVTRFLNKTFELGKRPNYEDVHDGSCCDCASH